MARAPAKLRFFLDQNVPDSVGRYLQARGHDVAMLRNHIPPDSPDPLVGVTALEAKRILISCDKDFNSQRFRQERFAQLSRISLSAKGPELLPAVEEHAEVLEFQFQRIPRDGRIVAHVAIGQIRFRTN